MNPWFIRFGPKVVEAFIGAIVGLAVHESYKAVRRKRSRPVRSRRKQRR